MLQAESRSSSNAAVSALRKSVCAAISAERRSLGVTDAETGLAGFEKATLQTEETGGVV